MENNNKEIEYVEPNQLEPCSECKYRAYDSFLNELWCDHKPPPNGLSSRLLIDKWGHCGFWKRFEINDED